jgi:hypothetical protein
MLTKQLEQYPNMRSAKNSQKKAAKKAAVFVFMAP